MTLVLSSGCVSTVTIPPNEVVKLKALEYGQPAAVENMSGRRVEVDNCRYLNVYRRNDPDRPVLVKAPIHVLTRDGEVWIRGRETPPLRLDPDSVERVAITRTDAGRGVGVTVITLGAAVLGALAGDRYAAHLQKQDKTEEYHSEYPVFGAILFGAGGAIFSIGATGDE